MIRAGIFAFVITGIFSVPLAGQCTFSLTPLNNSFPINGGSSYATLTLQTGSCNWTATTDSPTWITFSVGSGTGTGSMIYNVAANSGEARVGTITVLGQSFKVTQDAAVQHFNDVPSTSSYFNYVSMMRRYGIIAGCSSNPPLYCPSSFLTRAEMAVFVVVAYDLATGTSLTYSPTPHFRDVPASHWAFPFIQRLKELGITAGCSSNPPRYCPGSNITQKEMAVFMIATWEKVHNLSSLTYTTTPYFTDVPSTDNYFSFIQKMRDKGFRGGCGNNQYCPNNPVSRDQAAQMVMCSILGAATPPERIPSLLLSAHSRLQMNLGPVPIDKYLLTNFDSIALVPYVRNCSTANTVRQCFQSIFQSLASQHVDGIRFMFALCGGGWSTALNNCGAYYNSASLNSAWTPNLSLFFQDIKNSGINNITPTPRVWTSYNQLDPYCLDGTYTCGDQTGNYYFLSNAREPSLNDGIKWQQTFDSCTSQNVPLFFWPAAPFGVRGANNVGQPGGAWKSGDNLSYNCSPKNPYFVGWQHIYDVINAVLSTAQASALVVDDFDMYQEMDLANRTVELRMMYDNQHGDTGTVSVLDVLSYYMGLYGFDYRRIVNSVGLIEASVPYTECTSVFGDSARIWLLSEYYNGIFGQWVGFPNLPGLTNGLPCGGSIPVDWVSQPRYFWTPYIIDIHTYPMWDALDAAISYNSYKTFLGTFGVSGSRGNDPGAYNSLVMLGETHSGTVKPGETPVTCENVPSPSQAPVNVVSGFNGSSLVNSNVTVIRTWYNIESADACYPLPASIPYVPTN